MHTAERRVLHALGRPNGRFTSPRVRTRAQGEQLSDTSANTVPARGPGVETSYTAAPPAPGAPAAVASGDGIGRQGGEQAGEDRFAGYRRWLQQNYLPGSSDTLVCAFRAFLYRYGSGVTSVLPSSVTDLPPELPRHQVLDRYSQHTIHCPHCTAALSAVNALLITAGAVALGCLVLGVCAALVSPAGVLQPTSVIAALVTAAAVAAGMGLWEVRKRFYFMDWVHADHP